MSGTIADRLAELGIDLPDTPAPAGNYVPWAVTGNQAFIAGQVPFKDGELPWKGHVGRDVSLEDAQAAARQCGINILSQLSKACDGDLDRVVRCVKLGGFVACVADFTDHPKVVNGASDLMVEVFGEAGRHARFAVGAPSLPLGVPVEVDGVFEIRL